MLAATLPTIGLVVAIYAILVLNISVSLLENTKKTTE
jgi:hypothetical protein